MRRSVAAAAILFGIVVGQAWAVEPLAGVWRLERQELNGVPTNVEPLTLKIAPSGDQYAFAFSVPVNKVYFVSMSYTVRLDGTEADVKNAQGEKVGTVRISSLGGAQYNLTIRGPHRPESAGKLIVSPDGKTLTTQSDSMQNGHPAHLTQVFSLADRPAK